MIPAFATAGSGASVSVSAEALERIRTRAALESMENEEGANGIAGTPPSTCKGGAALSSPLKTTPLSFPSSPFATGHGRSVGVSSESLRAVKRKFAEVDDNASTSDDSDGGKRPSPEQIAAGDENMPPDASTGMGEGARHEDKVDYSSLFRRAGSGKAIAISDGAVARAKRAMEAGDSAPPSPPLSTPSPFAPRHSASQLLGGPASFQSPTLTTPIRNPGARPAALRRPMPAGIAAGSTSKFNQPFRSPLASPAQLSSPQQARTGEGGAGTKAPSLTPSMTAASPLGRMAIASPAARGLGGGDATTRIGDLRPGARGYRIQGRVAERSGRPAHYGVRGEARFSLTLVDADGGRLEVEAVAEHARRAMQEMAYGKTYSLSGGRLFGRRPSRDNPSGLVLSIDNTSEITLIPEEAPSPSATSPPHSKAPRILVPLKEIPGPEQEIDIVGVVVAIRVSSVGEARRSTVVGGEEGGVSPGSSSSSSRTSGSAMEAWKELDLVDQRGSTTLRLPQEYSPVRAYVGDVVLVYRAVTRRAEEGKRDSPLVLAQRGRSRLLLAPESDDARVRLLTQWRDRGEWKKEAAKIFTSTGRAKGGEETRPKENGEELKEDSWDRTEETAQQAHIPTPVGPARQDTLDVSTTKAPIARQPSMAATPTMLPFDSWDATPVNSQAIPEVAMETKEKQGEEGPRQGEAREEKTPMEGRIEEDSWDAEPTGSQAKLQEKKASQQPEGEPMETTREENEPMGREEYQREKEPSQRPEGEPMETAREENVAPIVAASPSGELPRDSWDETVIASQVEPMEQDGPPNGEAEGKAKEEEGREEEKEPAIEDMRSLAAIMRNMPSSSLVVASVNNVATHRGPMVEGSDGKESMRVELELSDLTRVVPAIARGEVAERLVGVTTAEASGMARFNRDEWRACCRHILGVPRLFRVRPGRASSGVLVIEDIQPIPYDLYLARLQRWTEELRRRVR